MDRVRRNDLPQPEPAGQPQHLDVEGEAVHSGLAEDLPRRRPPKAFQPALGVAKRQPKRAADGQVEDPAGVEPAEIPGAGLEVGLEGDVLVGEDNVVLGLTSVQHVPKKEARSKAEEMLREVGLQERMKHFPSEL